DCFRELVSSPCSKHRISACKSSELPLLPISATPSITSPEAQAAKLDQRGGAGPSEVPEIRISSILEVPVVEIDPPFTANSPARHRVQPRRRSSAASGSGRLSTAPTAKELPMETPPPTTGFHWVLSGLHSTVKLAGPVALESCLDQSATLRYPTVLIRTAQN